MEGVFGSWKRKYSLRLIVARLAKGAETSISMGFLVMCVEKILRLFRLFFVTIFTWIYSWQWPGSSWVVLRNICLLEAAESLVTALTEFTSCLSSLVFVRTREGRSFLFQNSLITKAKMLAAHQPGPYL